MINAALVLEGGSLRSLYTAGVLDFFLENGIEFESVIGVSAGALTAANYISKQKRRTARINILHSSDSEYYGVKQLLLKQSAFNFDYLFNVPINQLYPYDKNILRETRQKFYIAATNCFSGKVRYFEAGRNYEKMTKYLQASSSLPLLSPMTKVEGEYYLDGGIVEPIGINKALKEHYEKIVVVLTNGANYVRKPESAVIRTLFEVYYKKYPVLLHMLRNMPATYNHIKQKMDKMEKMNKIFVIRPENLPKIRSVEKDARKLIQLYFQGLSDAELHFRSMDDYLHS